MTIFDEARGFLRHLNEQGLDYMVVGGLALDVLGTPRMTMDIDIQILSDEGPAPGDAVFLGAIIQERSRDEVFGQEVVILHLPTYGVPIEVFLTDHWMTRQALERRRWVESDDLGNVPIPTPEDFMLLKSAFHQSPTRSKVKRASDGIDIESVVKRHGERLDSAYVEKNARRLGTWGFIEAVLEDAHN